MAAGEAKGGREEGRRKRGEGGREGGQAREGEGGREGGRESGSGREVGGMGGGVGEEGGWDPLCRPQQALPFIAQTSQQGRRKRGALLGARACPWAVAVFGARGAPPPPPPAACMTGFFSLS